MKSSVCVEKIRLMRVKIMQYALEISDHMERMDCMEYMDQVVGNIFGNIFEVFLKRSLKTDVTFRKMSVALVFFLV